MALPVESVFLREFVKTYVSEISFTAIAIDDLKRCGVGLADVLYVLKKGRVTGSEKEDSDGAGWFVEGVTCDGTELGVSLHVWCNNYQVRVLRVFRLKEVSHG